LVTSALSGFPLKWDAFVDGIVAWENIPSWDRLWDDFVQEETRRHSKTTCQHNGKDDEDNFGLSIKGKRKVNGSGGFASIKDMSKVKCFACHKIGPYLSQCDLNGKWHQLMVLIQPYYSSTHGIYPWYYKWHPPVVL